MPEHTTPDDAEGLFLTDEDTTPVTAEVTASPARAQDLAPLAVRMRPRSLDEVVGQRHVLGPTSPLRRLVEGHGGTSVVLYGPPGTGKTTLANLVAGATHRTFEQLSALNSGVKEVRAVIDAARRRQLNGRQTVLFIDEIHRFSKTQQDALLQAVENGTVLLIAATTENPSFSVVAPLLSRSLLVALEPLDEQALGELVERALTSQQGLDGRVGITAEARTHLIRLSGGDARRCLTYLDAAAQATTPGSDITSETLAATADQALVRYDRDGDQHYDIASALIKSIRGSDVDAALHYLGRMLAAGEDPRFITRRLIISASEDIGMADSQALVVTTAAAQAVAQLGMPEARITLAHAVVYLATAPKSNAAYTALDAALADIRRGLTPPVPRHLRDGHYAGAAALGNAVDYVYSHDDPRGVTAQQYAPDELVGRDYYQPTSHGAERAVSERLDKLRAIIRDRRSS